MKYFIFIDSSLPQIQTDRNGQPPHPVPAPPLFTPPRTEPRGFRPPRSRLQLDPAAGVPPGRGAGLRSDKPQVLTDFLNVRAFDEVLRPFYFTKFHCAEIERLESTFKL